ncbi:MAG: ASKHA domain-containing protein [Thermoguttaceae bacterium]|nr:ASKHA domain-containing protein [Thermoguttaceae bacterium]
MLSRILHAQRPGGLDDLRQAVVRAIDAMIGELAAEAGITREHIYEVVFSGNTTMQELLCGVDPRFLGEVPFVPATSDPVRVAAAELGLGIHPRGRAYVLPVIGGFVGGDTVAGILATRLDRSSGPTLLIDIGTNGEIVLWADGKLSAASTAAGPAFEGARISQGMRASAGAIEKVVVRDGDLHINVIGDVPPVGLCGSALIDAAAEFLRHGLMTSDGRLVPPAGLPPSLSPELRRRVLAEDGKTSVVLAWEADSGNGRAVALSQRDVRELQLASGAIRAGTAILLKRAGLKPADLEAVLIAGGFGNFIRRSNAQRIGLLPGEIPRHRIRYQGNTSLAGARLVAVSETARRTAEDLARRTEHVDLSSDPDFRWSFAESMIFP